MSAPRSRTPWRKPPPRPPEGAPSPRRQKRLHLRYRCDCGRWAIHSLRVPILSADGATHTVTLHLCPACWRLETCGRPPG